MQAERGDRPLPSGSCTGDSSLAPTPRQPSGRRLGGTQACMASRTISTREGDNSPIGPAPVDELCTLQATILEQLPSAVFVLDARGRIVLSNKAARLISGLATETNRPLPEQVDRYLARDPHSRQLLRPEETASARVLAGQVIERSELLVSHAERQSDVWLLVAGTPL